MKNEQPKNSSRRHLLIALFFVAWMAAIVWRLADLQITRRPDFLVSARAQQVHSSEIQALRGTIVDSRGEELATTIDPDTVVADLYKLTFKDEEKSKSERLRIATILAPVLGESKETLLAKLNGRHKLPVLKARVDALTSQKLAEVIEKNKLPGIELIKAPQRYYPNGTLAAHSIGYINAENKGVAGLELQLEKFLTGRTGQRLEEADASGVAFLRRDTPPTDGALIETTLDLALQHKVEAALSIALQETQSRSISAVVMEPQTGAILALANAPTFDPNARMSKDEDFARRNRAVSDTYEPGSVFKLVTYAAAIQEGLATPDEKIDCRSIMIGSRIKNDDHPGLYTVAEALAKSSNVGAMRLAQRIVNQRGKDALYNYITAFGFGRKTELDLPAEASGRVKPAAQWRDISLGSIPVGYEVTITPLQAVAAMAAIANGGVWNQPHLVKRIVANDGSILEAKPKSHRVISAEAAATVTAMLEQVVTGGTARRALQFGGYRAAGKTGTAYKVDPETHRYSSSKFMATFVGFVPVSKPRFAIIVTIDEPKGAHQGGQVSAPIFNHIAEAALGDYGVLPETEEHQQAIARLGEIYRAKLSEQGKDVAENVPTEKLDNEKEGTKKGDQSKGQDNAVANARPAANGDKPRRNEVAVASTPNKRTENSKPEATDVMPDLRGRNIRDVIGATSRLQLKLKANGNGLAVKQSLAPGTRIRPGEICAVEFR